MIITNFKIKIFIKASEIIWITILPLHITIGECILILKIIEKIDYCKHNIYHVIL